MPPMVLAVSGCCCFLSAKLTVEYLVIRNAHRTTGPALQYAELWDSRNPTAPTINVTHPDNYFAQMGLN